MRGETKKQGQLFSYVSLEERVPVNHPLRRVKDLCDEVLGRMSGMFDVMYSETGRPSQPPERLLKSMVLMALYSVRSDRMFCEELDYNLLFRWFLEMTLDERSFDATTFTKNRQRLLEHEVGKEFLNEVVRYAEQKKLLSDEHFTVDGTLIEAWASLKSFKPKDDGDKDGSNFHGQTRCNDTHQSTTDPEARLFRKSYGKEAKLSYSMHVLMDNRHGLVVDACVEQAGTKIERDAALKLLDRQKNERGVKADTLGADKAYHCQDFISELRRRKVRPHVACIDRRKLVGLDRRTTRHASYWLSQMKRKLVEQTFGWVKTVGCMRKTRFIGCQKTELAAHFNCAAYNLLRVAKLVPT